MKIELAWSYMLDFENQANPFYERRDVIARWQIGAVTYVEETAEILRKAREIADHGLSAKDALHVACAMAAKCDYFLTTDDVVVKKMQGYSEIKVVDPTQFIIEVAR